MIVWGIIIALASFILGCIIAYKVCVLCASQLLTDIEFAVLNPLLVRLNLIKQYFDSDTSSCITQNEIQKVIQDCINIIREKKAK